MTVEQYVNDIMSEFESYVEDPDISECPSGGHYVDNYAFDFRQYDDDSYEVTISEFDSDDECIDYEFDTVYSDGLGVEDLRRAVEDLVTDNADRLGLENESLEKTDMRKYEIHCFVEGYAYPKKNETFDDFWDRVDCGVLTDIDFAESNFDEQDFDANESVRLRGVYTMYIEANSQKEALEKAPDVFEEDWTNGEVDCHDLDDTELVEDKNGDFFRCVASYEIEKPEFEIMDSNKVYESAERLFANGKIEINDFGVHSLNLYIYKDEEYIKEGESYEEYLNRMEEIGEEREYLPSEEAFDNGVVNLYNMVFIVVKDKDDNWIGDTGDIHISDLYGWLEGMENGSLTLDSFYERKEGGDITISEYLEKVAPEKKADDKGSVKESKKDKSDVERD